MDIRQEFRQLLFDVELARRSRTHPVWAKMGLIAGQPRVLGCLIKQDHITQKVLSDMSAIEPATLSRALDRLEAMELISRKSNPDCRRSYHIALTDTGRAKALEVQQVFKRLEQEMTEGLTEQEIQTLMDLLKKVYSNLK